MSDGEQARLVAWHRELLGVHERLRRALLVARESLDAEPADGRDLLLFCHGFCVALSGHHASEDACLFPELAARHPELGSVLGKLRQDHSTIAYLLTELDHAIRTRESRPDLERHLDGVGAIMESHFAYEERQLLAIMETLDLDADVHQMLGPL